MEWFKDYTFDWKTEVFNDHKPLECILSKLLHSAARHDNSSTELRLVGKAWEGKQDFLADTRSGAVLHRGQHDESEFSINIMKYLSVWEESLLQIQGDTEGDESLQAVIQKGWAEYKSYLPGIISPHFNMGDEMSI